MYQAKLSNTSRSLKDMDSDKQLPDINILLGNKNCNKSGNHLFVFVLFDINYLYLNILIGVKR